MTLISMLEHSIQHYGSQPALAHKPKGGTYQDISYTCLLYTSPSPRDGLLSRMPSSA